MPKLQNETELTKARDELSKKFIQISETSKVKLEKQIAEATSLLEVIKREDATITSQLASLESSRQAVIKSEVEHKLKVDKINESSKALAASQISTTVKLDGFKAANDITSYNALVVVMNKSVEDYNALARALDVFEKSYQAQVESHNALVQKLEVAQNVRNEKIKAHNLLVEPLGKAQESHNDLIKMVNGAISILQTMTDLVELKAMLHLAHAQETIEHTAEDVYASFVPTEGDFGVHKDTISFVGDVVEYSHTV